MEETLRSIQGLLPGTRVIWSDILIRQRYEGEVKRGAGKRSTLSLNKYARKLCFAIENACVIKHSHLINPLHAQQDIYFKDGVHLGELGKLTFRQNLSNALSYFNAHPDEPHFPPRGFNGN